MVLKLFCIFLPWMKVASACKGLEIYQPIYNTIMRWMYDGELEDAFSEVGRGKHAEKYCIQCGYCGSLINVFFAWSLHCNTLNPYAAGG